MCRVVKFAYKYMCTSLRVACICVIKAHPVFEVLAVAVQDVLQLDDAVGHEVVIANGCIVEDRQFYLAALVNLGGKLVVPRRTVGPLLGGGLAHARVVYVKGDVRVQE